MIVLSLFLVFQVFSPFRSQPNRYIQIPRPISLDPTSQRHYQAAHSGLTQFKGSDTPLPNDRLKEESHIFHKKPHEIPRHILAVHNSPDPQVLAQKKASQLETYLREKKEIAEGIRQAELIVRRRQIEQSELNRVLQFKAPEMSPEDVSMLKLKEKHRKEESVQIYLDSLPPDQRESALRRHQAFLEQNWKCFHIRSFKGDPNVDKFMNYFQHISRVHPEVNADVEVFPAAIWKISKLPQLIESLPSPAKDHRDGPLIWAGCQKDDFADALYITNMDALVSHLETRYPDLRPSTK